MDFVAPTDLAEAFAALEQPDVVVLAGGTDRFAQHGGIGLRGSILDVTRLSGFRGITRTAGGWRIGAATRWSDVISADLPPWFEGLKAAARQVGSRQIQNAGTIGGNLCNASPAADGVPPLLTLDARVELVSRTGARLLPLDEFITGVRRTALAPGELVASIEVPDRARDTVAGFEKLGSRRYLVISIAMVAVSLRVAAGRISEARVAVGSCSPVARRLPVLEERLEGHPLNLPFPLDADCLSPLAPISDARATGTYRPRSVSVLLTRLLGDLASRGERLNG